MTPRDRPKREICCLVAALACCAAHDCDAIDRVILEVGQLSTAGVQARDATITLEVGSHEAGPSASATATQLQLAQANTSFRDVNFGCNELLIKAPLFACNQGRIAAHGGPTGQIAMNAAAAYDTSNGAVSFSGSGLEVAAGVTRFTSKLQWGTWSLHSESQGLDLIAAGKLVQPWFQLPQGDTLSGHVNLQVVASGQLRGKTVAHLEANTSDFNYSNQPGTLVAQNLAATITASATKDRDALAADVKLQSPSGQALAGAVLLDFAKNPLNVTAHVEPDGKSLAFNRIQLHQTDLIDAQGAARIATGGPAILQQAHFDIQRLEFAAAYRSFLQLTLATTDFGALNVGGRAVGDLDIANDAVTAINAHVQNVSMADATARLSLANANGELHWAAQPAGAAPTGPIALGPTTAADAARATMARTEPAPAAPVQKSQLSWSASSLYGLIGGPVQLNFLTRGSNFALTDATRFPIFDGALIVHKLDVRNFGADAELEFDAHLEPISMPLLSKAFGWPILNGQLAGRVPGVSYRNHVLTVDGDLSANVFAGTITGSRIKLTDPLGPWPRLDADVTARHLDLDLLTHTFSIGSISGRLDADIQGLELFNWSPVAFNARLQTTPGDESEHRISQRAVTSISSVGGGGGGVTAALQSGVLQFFKTFHYDRIGISCQLRDEVCLMSGLEPAKNGYYLVKGRGLPRIDIIGNAGRVDWTQLVAQISASMHSQNITVR
ncbi:MAG: hypothetical protein JSR66_27365 [Proteobacteria bacterium]|nr:hypothetical protein [Pseudomonadota bacterium]